MREQVDDNAAFTRSSCLARNPSVGIGSAAEALTLAGTVDEPPGVAMSGDAARKSACATICTNLGGYQNVRCGRPINSCNVSTAAPLPTSKSSGNLR
jgi:hypothetical protein